MLRRAVWEAILVAYSIAVQSTNITPTPGARPAAASWPTAGRCRWSAPSRRAPRRPLRTRAKEWRWRPAGHNWAS